MFIHLFRALEAKNFCVDGDILAVSHTFISSYVVKMAAHSSVDSIAFSNFKPQRECQRHICVCSGRNLIPFAAKEKRDARGKEESSVRLLDRPVLSTLCEVVILIFDGSSNCYRFIIVRAIASALAHTHAPLSRTDGNNLIAGMKNDK